MIIIKSIRKQFHIVLILLIILLLATSCSGNSQKEQREITIFAAKSMNKVMDELIEQYEEEHADVDIIPVYDGSGTLMEQIKAGAVCDIFLPADTKQMDQLEKEGLLQADSRENLLCNKVCLVTYKGSNTAVTSLDNLAAAKNLAIADGSVPVGKYTRQALGKLGILDGQLLENEQENADESEMSTNTLGNENNPETDYSHITTSQLSEALGGISINECGSVGVVVSAICEGASEVGTVYRSDVVALEDNLEIIEEVSTDLTGEVIYPIAMVDYDGASSEVKASAEDFMTFLRSEAAKNVFENYGFEAVEE